MVHSPPSSSAFQHAPFSAPAGTGKWLIIAEKPSVAQDIARALGGFTRHKEYFESPTYLLSSALGHLLELKAPESSEPKRGKWSLANLPVLPNRFELKPIGKTQERLKLLIDLAHRPDVVGLINACDAGREGELIFHYIVTYGALEKPIRRLWLQSMTPAAIRAAFAELRPHEALSGLRAAAISRAESDWLIGINATRALTAFNSQTGGFQLTPAGRVQTPTLAMVVARERQIQTFQPRPYWEIEATIQIAAGSYRARWFDEKASKSDDPDASPYRLWSEADAQAVLDRCREGEVHIEETSKPSLQSPPLLYDLTSLQRDANQRFGFSARQTLALAQALYERHKLITYPRTDARFLPEDMLGAVPAILEALSPSYRPYAQTILERGWIRLNKRIFDNAKVTDHFAIIPTGERCKTLSETEERVYDLIVRRFLAAFYPPAEYRLTSRLHRLGIDTFKSEGKVLITAGWLEVYGKSAVGDDDPLPPLADGERCGRIHHLELKTLATKPPARYTEATLLSAMEGAGKLLDDETLKAAMAGRGLGTPATRAQIIEGLIEDGYLVRDGRELIPTPKAFSLMTLLRALGIQILASPELTGEWEHRLARMERGEIDRAEFMAGIRQMAVEIVDRVKRYDADTVPGDYVTLTVPCPKCHATLHETYKKYQCSHCEWGIFKEIAGRILSPAEAETLIRDRRLGPLTGFRNRRGRPFTAALILDENLTLQFQFDEPDPPPDPEAIAAASPVGPCPRCGNAVILWGNHYRCCLSLADPPRCDFRLPTVILHQPITPEIATQLLVRRETPLLTGFISTRTRRKFKAHLLLDEAGNVIFRFPERSATSSS
ncbi:MAG: DNA topoisomerase III [Hydrogenophilus sp.]|nr:DNA topoisomerase III [Hydrogenophilus sp.]